MARNYDEAAEDQQANADAFDRKAPKLETVIVELEQREVELRQRLPET